MKKDNVYSSKFLARNRRKALEKIAPSIMKTEASIRLKYVIILCFS